MAQENKLIMVVKVSDLFKGDRFNGFRPRKGVSYKERILQNYRFRERNKVENNSSYKQPIPYILIINPGLSEVYAYQRSAADLYKELRLEGKWSLGVGGHIERMDAEFEDPVLACALRETNEEIDIGRKIEKEDLEHVGYINEDLTEVGTVHFGILYFLKTCSSVKIKDSEIKLGEYKSPLELKEMFSKEMFELWSQLCFQPLISCFEVTA